MLKNKKMYKAYYYPPASKHGYDNPYSINYKQVLSCYFKLYDKDNAPSRMLSLSFLRHSLFADVFYINWLENVPFLRMGYIQFFVVRLALWIIKFRQKKIVWMLHNLHPHAGFNEKSQYLQDILFKQSNLIVAHSQDAYNYAKSKNASKIVFFNHPIKTFDLKDVSYSKTKYDVLIWGTILPYKGIYEFLHDSGVRDLGLTVKIIGLCKDSTLSEKIISCCSEKITFENRRANFDELRKYIVESRYVLFPYVGNCVSSSGALIDTIALGGNPVGPATGAFKDLALENVCLTYETNTDLMQLLSSSIVIAEEYRSRFIEQNSWDYFVKKTIEEILSNT